MKYKLLLHEEAVAFWSALNRPDRERLLWALKNLAAAPHQAPDFFEADDHGRRLSGFIEGAFALIVYIDDAVGEIRAIDLRYADN